MSSLKLRQKRVLDFFHRQQLKNMTSHAYLLNGKNTDELAKYMAKSILCQQQTPGYCDHCSDCLNVEREEHASLIIVNPDEERIKKENILELKSELSQTALEKRQKRVYIIHNVDAATPSALNSLLKFLEEPSSDITAILTAQSLNRVLDTIQSRCLILTLDEEQQDVLRKKALEEGYDELMIHAYLELENDWEGLEKRLNDKESAQLFDAVNDFLSVYSNSKIEAASLYNAVLNNHMKVDLNKFSESLKMMFRLTDNYDLKSIIVDIQDRIRPGVSVKLLIDQFSYMVSEREML
ncbi:hypothetical protein ERUR111494_07395 [Erysipelothrix urinaevulpis]|uniref:hypothetical protein n=1 Tax=Erysipelothrix urinaevulpis TaxID=2683717 RepID=UPI0013581F19|nr:hypothetical protein [Erysipelothrix urinaevulpis]